jgi:hypothetical protein
MLAELMLALWITLCVYLFWYVVKATTYQSLGLNDLALVWKVHKREAGCKSTYIQDLLVKGDEVVGFRCGCGHEYLQKRLISQKPKRLTLPCKLATLSQFDPVMEDHDLVRINVKKI